MTITENLDAVSRPEIADSASKMAPIAVVTALADRQFGVLGNKASGTIMSGKGVMNFGGRWLTHFLLLVGADQAAPYADAVIVKPIKGMANMGGGGKVAP